MHANIEAVRIQYPFMQFLEIALYFPPTLNISQDRRIVIFALHSVI